MEQEQERDSFGQYKRIMTDAQRKESRKNVLAKQKAWRAEAVRAVRVMVIVYLGGKCSNCGLPATLDNSHLDHIDPLTKTFYFSRDEVLFRSVNEVFREADKCQVLCSSCHTDKSRVDIPTARGQVFRDLRKRKGVCIPCLRGDEHAFHDQGSYNGSYNSHKESVDGQG